MNYHRGGGSQLAWKNGMDDWHAWTFMNRILHIDHRQIDKWTELVLVKLILLFMGQFKGLIYKNIQI